MPVSNADRNPVDGSNVIVWEARCRAVPQVGAVRIQHQAGGQDVAGLRLDYPA